MTWRSPPSNKHFAYKGGGIPTYQNFCVRPLDIDGAIWLTQTEYTLLLQLGAKVAIPSKVTRRTLLWDNALGDDRAGIRRWQCIRTAGVGISEHRLHNG
jgi:hypothetical protein